MAWPQFTISLVILSFISLLIRYGVVYGFQISHVSNVSSVFPTSPADDGSRRTTMLLPLFPPKDTSRGAEISRRRLQKSPASARMSLHDDLLLNGFESVAIAQNLNYCCSILFFGWLDSKWLLMQILYNSYLDWNTTTEVCSYCWYREYSYLCPLLFL